MNQTSPEVLLILNCLCYPLLCWVPMTTLVVLKVTGHLKLRNPIQFGAQDRRSIPAMREAAKRDPSGFKAS
jgi:hypothetical protein